MIHAALLPKQVQLNQLDIMREMLFEPLFHMISNPNLAFPQVCCAVLCVLLWCGADHRCRVYAQISAGRWLISCSSSVGLLVFGSTLSLRLSTGC